MRNHPGLVLLLLALSRTPLWAAPPSSVVAPSGKPAARARPKIDASVYGRVQLIVGIDPQNQGDVPDVNVAPDGSLKEEWNASVQANASLGGRFTYPEPLAGFTASGQVLTVLYVRRIFSVTTAGFTLDNPDAGVKIGIGRFVQPTVNSLSPGVFQFSTNWGNLIHATAGAHVAKSFDRVLVQVGAGRPDFVLFTEPITPTASAAPRTTFVEGRIAYIDPDVTGELPSNAVGGPRPGPLTIGVSGAYGMQRVGIDEKESVAAIAPTAVEPVVEDVSSWIVSAEAILPFHDFVLAGEWYLGRGANAYIGAVRQRPHVDPMTGRHTALESRGGWVQLSWSLPEDWTLVAVGGLEQVTKGLGVGVPVDATPRISQNRLLALSLSRTFGFGMHSGVQLQRQSTHYLGLDDGRMFSVLIESSIDF